MYHRKFKISLLVIALLVINTKGTFSQESDQGIGGSPYSAYGIGMPIDITSHNFRAQGLLGVSGITLETTTLANPAVWGATYFAQATTGLQLSKFNIESSTSNESNTNISTDYLHILFPLSRGKLGLSLGLYPVTRSNFRVSELGSFMSSATDTVFYENEIRSSGGVSKFEVGFGIKISNNISLGYAPSVAFMTLQTGESFRFSSNSFISQTQSSKITGVAFSQRFGITASFRKLFSEQDRISFGATLDLPYTIDGKRKFTSQKQIGGIIQEVDLTSSISNAEGDVYTPLETSFGIGYAPSIFVNFGIEGVFEKWSDYRSDINPSDELVMSDRLKVGFGGQFHPYKTNSNQFFSRFKYSGGVSYDTGHLTIQGNDISTLWLNTGLGILGRNSSSSFPSMDISFQYGFRGTIDNNLIKERIWSLGFSVNLNERMFIRPKLR